MLRCPFFIMAENLPHIPLPSGIWVDLYDATSITVGTRIEVENVGVCDVKLSSSAAQPAPDTEGYNLLRREGQRLSNTFGDLGAWALCPNQDGKVSVRELG